MLRAVPSKSATLPKVRMSQALLDALVAQASAAGISGSEAVRQLLESYLADRCELPAMEASAHDAFLPPTRVSKQLAAGVRWNAELAGVSVAETVRRVLASKLPVGA